MKFVQIIWVLAAVIGMSWAACKGKEAKKDSEAVAPASPSDVAKEPVQVSPAGETKPVESRAASQPEAAEPPVFKGPGEKLVKEIDGFSITAAPRYFGPETLYDLINGGAEVYTAFGLKEMVTADYTSKEKAGVTVTVEIYDMETQKNAKGRFAKFLEGREDKAAAGKGLPEDIASRGLLGGASASFWKDKYLVNLTLLDESEKATMESMTALGGELLPVFAKSLDDAI